MVKECNRGYMEGYDRGRQCLHKMQGITTADKNYSIGYDRGYENAQTKYCEEDKVDE
jgi:hypothetical protein